MKVLTWGDFQPLIISGKRDTKRRYVSPTTGEVISLRQFQKGARGGISYSEYRKQQTGLGIAPQKHKTSVKKDLQLYMEHVNRQAFRDGLPPITEEQARKSPEFQLIRKWLRTKDNSPTGKKAQALVMLGLREEWWQHNVGDS